MTTPPNQPLQRTADRYLFMTLPSKYIRNDSAKRI
jgi:hypothetical protein